MDPPARVSKTTYLARQLERAAYKVGPANVLVASLTKAAAREVAGRDTSIPPDRIGTLHAHAFRQLEGPNLAESAEGLTDWNIWVEQHGLMRSWRVSKQKETDLDYAPTEVGSKRDGDDFLQFLAMMRARMTPREMWSPKLQLFAEAWEEFKQSTLRHDFTDLITEAIALGGPAPGEPVIIMLDEAQDLSRLEFTLARQWGAHAEQFVVVGDPDQCLYSWRGTDPHGMYQDAVASETVLSQSYRVPAAVHRYAVNWIESLPDRPPISYEPRFDENGEVVEGAVARVGHTWRRPEGMVAKVNGDVADGRSVMILSTCGYMLEPTLQVLRRKGVPFWNPYRPKHGGWNPMRAAHRLAAFLKPDAGTWGHLNSVWSWHDVHKWMGPMEAHGLLRRGAKNEIEERAQGLESFRPAKMMQVLDLFLHEEDREAAFDMNVRWWRDHLLGKAKKVADYPVKVFEAHGGLALRDDPPVTVGTVHCSPPDELVLTKRGQVPIVDLVPEDRLVSYHRPTNSILGTGDHFNARGYMFKRSERAYKGHLVTIETSESRTRVTPNHRVLARLDEDAFCERWAVYLMKRGDWWRLGICVTAHRPYRSGGVSGRLATERADDGWILGVFDTRREALIGEAVLQGQYGIPGLTFQSAKARSLNHAALAGIHDRTAVAIGPRALQLLADHGLSADWPLYRRQATNIAKTNMRTWFVTEAANLVALSERVCMGTFGGGRSPVARRATVTTAPYDDMVYGLDVPPHHHYVSGNAVVHNSVKGGEADSVYVFPDLSTSGYITAWERPVDRPPTLRLFYVAFTRARETLTLCTSAGGTAVTFPKAIKEKTDGPIEHEPEVQPEARSGRADWRDLERRLGPG